MDGACQSASRRRGPVCQLRLNSKVSVSFYSRQRKPLLDSRWSLPFCSLISGFKKDELFWNPSSAVSSGGMLTVAFASRFWWSRLLSTNFMHRRKAAVKASLLISIFFSYELGVSLAAATLDFVQRFYTYPPYILPWGHSGGV